MEKNKNVGITQGLPCIALTTKPEKSEVMADGKTIFVNRKFAAYLTFGIQQDFDKIPDPVVLNSNTPCIVIDGDDLDAIQTEVFNQLRQVFQNARDIISGKLSKQDIQKEISAEKKRINDAIDNHENQHNMMSNK